MKNMKKNVYVSPELSMVSVLGEDILTMSPASSDFGMELDWDDGI